MSALRSTPTSSAPLWGLRTITGTRGKTSDKRGSGEPPRTTGAPTGCRNSSPPAASGRAAQDQSMAVRSNCRRAPTRSERQTDRRTGRCSAAYGRLVRVAQARIRRTEPPDQSASDPSSIQPPPIAGLNQRWRPASTGEFFNTIGAKRTSRFKLSGNCVSSVSGPIKSSIASDNNSSHLAPYQVARRGRKANQNARRGIRFAPVCASALW